MIGPKGSYSSFGRRGSLFFKVIGGLSAMVVAVMAANFVYQNTVATRSGMNEYVRWSATLTDTLLAQLEHAMLSHDIESIHKTVEKLRENDIIKSVFVVNKELKVAIASSDEMMGRAMSFSDPNCSACHEKPSALRPEWVIVSDPKGGRIFRRGTPILNRKACHECHGESDRTLGMFLVDLSMKDFDAGNSKRAGVMAAATAVIALAMALFMWLLLHFTVLKKVKAFTIAINSIDEHGRIPHVGVESNDELGELAGQFNGMADKLAGMMDHMRSIIENVDQTVSQLSSSSNELRAVAAQQATGSSEQAAGVQEVLTTAAEIAASARQIAENSLAVTSLASNAEDAAVKSEEVIRGAAQAMIDIHQKVGKVSNSMLALANHSGRIGNIIGLIEEISDNTKLLSLNASIEAAGAGDAGKRFGVVAAEIQRLAAATNSATNQITKLVDEIQAASTTAAMQVEDSTKAVENWRSHMEGLSGAFTRIEQLIKTASEAITVISTNTQQQTTACEQLTVAIEEIKLVADGVAVGSKETSKAISALNDIATGLLDMVKHRDY